MELRKYRPLTIAYSLELSSTMPCFSYSLIFNLNVWVSFNESSSLDCANMSAGEIDSGSEVDFIFCLTDSKTKETSANMNSVERDSLKREALSTYLFAGDWNRSYQNHLRAHQCY